MSADIDVSAEQIDLWRIEWKNYVCTPGNGHVLFETFVGRRAYEFGLEEAAKMFDAQDSIIGCMSASKVRELIARQQETGKS